MQLQHKAIEKRGHRIAEEYANMIIHRSQYTAGNRISTKCHKAARLCCIERETQASRHAILQQDLLYETATLQHTNTKALSHTSVQDIKKCTSPPRCRKNPDQACPNILLRTNSTLSPAAFSWPNRVKMFVSKSPAK